MKNIIKNQYLKENFNLYKIKKKPQLNHTYLCKKKKKTHPISIKNNHNLIKK
jgi:hypothetical protein